MRADIPMRHAEFAILADWQRFTILKSRYNHVVVHQREYNLMTGMLVGSFLVEQCKEEDLLVDSHLLQYLVLGSP